MAKKSNTDLTDLSSDELAGKQKTIKSLLGVLWSLAGLYIVYITYRILTMESGEEVGDLAPLGSGLAVIAAVSVIVGSQLGRLKAEAKRRESAD